MISTLEKLEKLRIDLQTQERPKSARQYADDILGLPSKEERSKALEQVPDEMRSIVKFYVYDAYARRKRKPLPDLKQKRHGAIHK